MCDLIPMDVFHILLRRPWKFDKKVTHDGRRNCYSFEKDGVNHVILPLQKGNTVEKQPIEALVLLGKEYL